VKIYSGQGDRGETELGPGVRVRKDDLRLEGVGAVEEANAAVGVVRAFLADAWVGEILESVQNHLFALSQALLEASVEPKPLIRAEDVHQLEAWIDAVAQELFPLQNFVIPTGVPAAALLHWARTVVRRAERRVVALREDGRLEVAMSYLNRLSDLLFVLARKLNHEQGIGDIIASF
jgi:cob(I)alamin adenosyltransferase